MLHQVFLQLLGAGVTPPGGAPASLVAEHRLRHTGFSSSLWTLGEGASGITAQRLIKLWLLGSRVLWPTGFSCLRHAESSQIRDPQCPLHGPAGSYPLYHREVLAPPILTPRLHLDQNGKVGRGQDGLGRPQVTICVAPYSQQREHWQFLTHWFSNR